MSVVAMANPGAMLKDLKARVSGAAVALVSRDGSVLHAEMPPGTYVETFAIMCATLVGAAATASLELDRAPPTRIVVEGSDSTTVLVTSGPKSLLVAVASQDSDPPHVVREVERFASLLSVE